MNPRLTDRERCHVLEARVAELEEEVSAYKRLQQIEQRDEAFFEGLDHMRCRLRRAHYEAGGPTVAAILMELLNASPRAVARERMFTVTRNPRSKQMEGADSRTIDVQLVKLRKALAKLGHPGVIQTLDGRGWMIEPHDRDMIKAALAV